MSTTSWVPSVPDRLRRSLEELRDIVAVARERNVTFLAAGFVYYAFVSIIPLLVLALVAGRFVFGGAFTTMLVSQVSTLLSDSGKHVVENMLQNSNGQVGAGVASLLVLGWGALKVFRGLDIAFGEVYDTDDSASLLEQVKDGTLVAVTTLGALTVLTVSNAVAAVPASIGVPYPVVASVIVLVAGLVLVFLPLYYVFPPVEMSLRQAFPGAAVAAVGWLVLQEAFQLYANRAGQYEAYGILGAVLLFVTWLYFAGVVVLLGAVVNAVLGDDAGSSVRSDSG